MAALKPSCDLPNDSVINGADSGHKNDIVVRRKISSTAVISDDEEEEKNAVHTEFEIDKEHCNSVKIHCVKNWEERNVMMDCCDEVIDQLSPNCQDIVKESTNSSSIVQTASLEVSTTEDDMKSLRTNNRGNATEDVRKEEKLCYNVKRFNNILDSDSEDEISFNSVNKKTYPSDNDSYDNRSASPGSDSMMQRKDDGKKKSVNIPRRVLSSESEDEDPNTCLQRTNINNISKPTKISSLIDSDSEEDTSSIHKFGRSSNEDEPMTKSNTMREKEKPVKKKRTGSIRSAKTEAMHEIHSETQRMLRESEVRLPYHKPKQRTLKEFLSRKKDLPSLPKTLTTAAKVKMAGKLVGKVLEKKEKEAELFYKSSSDSDVDEVVTAGILISDIKPDSAVVENEVEDNSMIEETQKIIRKDLQQGQSIKEAIKQGDKSLGLPRKLFISINDDAEGTECLSQSLNNESETTTKPSPDLNQRRKEFKQGLKDVSIPRNLFGSECNQLMDIGDEGTNTDHRGKDELDEIQESSKGNTKQLEISDRSDQPVEDVIIDEFVKSPMVQRCESMERVMEDFELKVSEDPYEISTDKQTLHDIAVTKTDANEFEAITETPSINSREAWKRDGETGVEPAIIIANKNMASNNMEKSENPCIISVDNEQTLSINTKSTRNNEDSKERNKPIGHVYGLPLPDFDVEAKTTEARILPDIMRLTPKLRGSPDMIIELSPPKAGVDILLRRFLNHSVTKKPEYSPKITAICTEQTENGLKVTKEVLPYRIPISDKNDDPELSKPGAKLIRLKEELQQQMAIQRTKEWIEKESEMKILETDEIYHSELSDCGMDDELDDEEEEDEAEEMEMEMDDNNDENIENEADEVDERRRNDEESDLDEHDLSIRKQNNKNKCSFIDAEAAISNEGDEISDKNSQEDTDSNISSNEDAKDKEYKESKARSSQSHRTHKLKRIVEAFHDDDSTDSEVKEVPPNVRNCDYFKRIRTDVDMFATNNNSDDDLLSGMEDDLPVYQQRTHERSQFCATPSVTNNSLITISPTTQLTALNTGSKLVNIDSNSMHNPLQLIVPRSLETTPIEAKCYQECDSEKREKLQKKLFDDTKHTPNDIELMSLCSGQFFENPSNHKGLDELIDTDRKTNISEAELLDLCSGTFVTQPLDIKKLEADGGKVQGDSASFNNSPFPSNDKSSTIMQTRIMVCSSDDEEETHLQVKNTSGRYKKRIVKMLQLSDAEDEDEDKSDGGNLSGVDGVESDGEKFVDYDSEENEIVIPKKDIRKAAARFLDEEAELSESEWGSADEDERDMDKLDLEEADLEDIDQDQVKQQLGKIHMRQVLDADRREVRLLQEILLDDGDLHSDSASRQRKFKWKNIDTLNEDGQDQSDNVDEAGVSLEPNEAESELEWRKQRLEREQFLEEQRMKEATENVNTEAGDSQLFQLGMRALKKTKNSKIPNRENSEPIVDQKSRLSVIRHTVADLFTSPSCGKKTFALQNAIHRGSFLARGEESLARLSLITKQNNDQAIIRTKKSRNFVFAHLSPAIEASVESDTECEHHKNTDPSNEKSRKRKPTSSQTPVASKKTKTEHDQSKTRTKLFD